MNGIAELVFEFSYYGNTVHQFSYYATVVHQSNAVYVIYSHNKYAYIHIYMFMQHHNDTINN